MEILQLWQSYKKVSLVIKMTVGFILGVLLALIIGDKASILKPLGDLLIQLLSLIAIPVIFLTVVLAVNKMNAKTLGKFGGKLMAYYVATTAAAVVIGVSLALLFNPGHALSLPDAQVEQPDIPKVSDILLQIVPSNIFEAFSTGDLMAILFTAVIIGMAISSMLFAKDKKVQDYGQVLDKFFTALNEMFYKILNGILHYAPIGVFAISASTFGVQGWETLKSLLTFTAVFYLGLILMWVIVYFSFLKLSGFKPIQFVVDIKEAILTAFFTSSSIASLPIAIDSAKKAGVSERTANFSMPLGAIFNSDGGALRMGLSLVFAANITGLQLSFMDFMIIVAIGTLLSVGTAGVPAAGLVTLSAVLSIFGLPLEIVALIAGVDAIIGMGGTASNVVGDIIGAAVIDERKDTSSAA